MLASSLVVAGLIYVTGVWRVWHHAGYGRGIRPLAVWTFTLGWAALAIALSRTFDHWSDESQAAHMVQHELLMVVAAPLLALSAPLVAMLWTLPASARVRVAHAFRAPWVAGLWQTLTKPAVAFLTYALALWIWHAPALYDAALEDEWIHALQHLSFFGTAALFWWGILHGQHGRVGYGAAVVYLFATAVHGGVLGALLTVSPHVWYAPYAHDHGGRLGPLEDQQLAGLLMWIPAGLTFTAGALFLLAAWLQQSDRISRFTNGPALRSPRLP